MRVLPRTIDLSFARVAALAVLAVLAGPAAGTAARAADAADPSAAPALLWPTDAGRCVTSSFCEFRSGHFHAGIDVSTNGVTGFRCFAVGDGDVVRVRVGCRGYGKALYLRLRDGRTAVYAHLDRFAGAIEDSARAHGRRTGSAYFDREFAPGTFRVRRGDEVAFTGETGVGVPHLHFEIRDSAERPLDPLRNGLTVVDKRAPRIKRIALTPLDAGSSVDGSSDTQFFAVPSEGGIARVIPVTGAIGVSVESMDMKDRCNYQLSPARLELLEDGEPLHIVRFDAFSFDETGHLDFQVDPRFSYTGLGRFQHLFRRSGNDLPFLTTFPGEGVLRAESAEETRRAIEILVADPHGNARRTKLSLSFAQPPAVETLEVEEVASGRFEVRGQARAGGRDGLDVEVSVSFDGGRTWANGSRVSAEPGGLFRAALPTPQSGVVSWIVRARAFDGLGAGGLARSVGVGLPPEAVDIQRVTAVTRGSFYEVQIPESVPFRELVRSDTSAVVVGASPAGNGARIDVPATATPEVADVFILNDPWGRGRPLRFAAPRLVRLGLEERFSPSPLADVTFTGNVLREPAYVVVREKPLAARPPSELQALGPAVLVDCGQVPLADDLDVVLRPERPLADSARAGIFVQDGRVFRYIGGTKERGGWSARTRTALPIVLMRDRAAPSLGQPRLETRSGRVRFVFSVRDGGSGIDCDGIEVRMNGAPVPNEMDGERGVVVAFPPGAGGSFEIRAVDRCGNASRWSGTMRLH